MSDELEECERCGRDTPQDNIDTVELLQQWMMCEGCVADMDSSVDAYDWRDRYTEEQHERALKLLRERDEIDCIIESYEDAQIVVHTDYVSSDIVTDFCNHFGLSIVSFGPQWQENEMWPCVTEHGSKFEIVLEYKHRSPSPVPMTVKIHETHYERITENDKQF